MIGILRGRGRQCFELEKRYFRTGVPKTYENEFARGIILPAFLHIK
jgi:hypothetical protein